MVYGNHFEGGRLTNHRDRAATIYYYDQEGGVVYRQKKRGEEARGFTTVRGAPQNGDGRTCVRQAEPQEILCLCYAGERLGVAFCVF